MQHRAQLLRHKLQMLPNTHLSLKAPPASNTIATSETPNPEFYNYLRTPSWPCKGPPNLGELQGPQKIHIQSLLIIPFHVFLTLFNMTHM